LCAFDDAPTVLKINPFAFLKNKKGDLYGTKPANRRKRRSWNQFEEKNIWPQSRKKIKKKRIGEMDFSKISGVCSGMRLYRRGGEGICQQA
jgi:hypothetical protein